MTWLRTTGLAIVSASFFHRCSPVSILAPAATHSWKRLTRLHEEHIIAQSKTASAPPPPPSSHGRTVFLFSFQLWEFVFSHSPKPQLRITIRKRLPLSVYAKAVQHHKVYQPLHRLNLFGDPCSRQTEFIFFTGRTLWWEIFFLIFIFFSSCWKNSHSLFSHPLAVLMVPFKIIIGNFKKGLGIRQSRWGNLGQVCLCKDRA